MTDKLHEVLNRLQTLRCDPDEPYFVPGLWADVKSVARRSVNPYDFYARRIQTILEMDTLDVPQGKSGGEWSRWARVYNLFPRVTTAFDHSDDGTLSITPRSDGWRETGTLLKCIALLPYIQYMGLNTVHLLPITAVGQDGKKGTLGSPYAIRNPYQLDANLAEPALGLSAEDLFAAFVEAAHHLGIRVVMEFVLRTGARDADWIKEHPEWFYWIRADVRDRPRGSRDPNTFGAPIFATETLGLIHARIESGDFDDLPAPPETYRALYTAPPRPEQVTLDDGRWFGTLDDGTRVRVPGAFSDFPPDDPQPPWSDVTYLRLYDHPDFNYMAYNTLRMYDARLARPEHANDPLWQAIIGIIPHYQQNFGIDGVMIDMGHALPGELKRRVVARAREVNPDFAFWDENFAIDGRSRDEGYNAVMGYMVFDYHQPEMLRNFIHRLAWNHNPIPFFATPENHNTLRAASRENSNRNFAYYTLPFSIAVPGMPVVHSGFELRETTPINSGLGFSPEMLARYDSDKLPLFSAWAFNWTNEDNLVKGIRVVMGLRARYERILTSPDPQTWHIGWSDNPAILAFSRLDGERSLTFIANTDLHRHQAGRVVIGGQKKKVQGVWGTPDAVAIYHDLNFYAQLSPGYVLILEGKDLPIKNGHLAAQPAASANGNGKGNGVGLLKADEVGVAAVESLTPQG